MVILLVAPMVCLDACIFFFFFFFLFVLTNRIVIL